MIERVARAIHVAALKLEEDQEGKPSGWGDEHPEEKRRMKKYARAAIAAMREPTGPMLEAEAAVLRGELGGLHDSAYWADGWMLAIWHSMIDAALK